MVTELYWVFAQILSEISPFVLVFDKKQQNKDNLPRIKLHFFKNFPCIMRFLLNFCLKSYLEILFQFSVKSTFNHIYLAYKTLQFVKIVTLLFGVFAQIWSEILPFVLVFDKKQQNKDDLPRIKIHFVKIVRIISCFCSTFVLNLIFFSFLIDV